MVFSSPVFLFIFLTAVYILYRIIPSIRLKNMLLLLFSLLFYTYGEPEAIILMIISIIMNYIFGLLMKKENKSRKACLVFSIVFNLSMLGIFKYAGFGAEMLNKLPFLSVSIPNIALPIGISFYTFHNIILLNNFILFFMSFISTFFTIYHFIICLFNKFSTWFTYDIRIILTC